MRSLSSVLLLALVSVAFAAPNVEVQSDAAVLSGRGGSCHSRQVRKEWRSLTVKQRLGYIKAVKCLNKLPSVDSSRGTLTRFDDFAHAHVLKTPVVHGVGQFYPWHRHFVTLYDKALRQECGYSGPTPYWDWRIEGDSRKSLASSSLLDPVHGFGGNGVPGTYTLPPDPKNEQEIPPFPGNPPAEILWNGCVQDGPFKASDFRLRIGPGRMQSDHCITRNFNEASWKPLITTAAVAQMLTYSDYWVHTNMTHNGPHLGGHAIFGGVMSNGFSTPGDPLFFPHHAGVDRLWWTWQKAAPGRLYAMNGPTTFPPGNEEVTLDFVLEYPGLGPNITVRDVMDITRKPNCYYYDKLI